MLLRTLDKSVNRNELRRFLLNNSGADILGNISRSTCLNSFTAPKVTQVHMNIQYAIVLLRDRFFAVGVV